MEAVLNADVVGAMGGVAQDQEVTGEKHLLGEEIPRQKLVEMLLQTQEKFEALKEQTKASEHAKVVSAC